MKKRLALVSVGVPVALVIFWIGSVIFEDPHVAEGRNLFQHYCAQCHGKKGRGDGFNAKYMDPRPRDLTDRIEEYMGPASHEEIYDVLSRDIKEEEEVTDPDEFWVPAAMPTYKYTLSDKELWELVAFIRTLHRHDWEKVEFAEEIESIRPTIQVSDQMNLDEFSPSTFSALVKKGRHLYDEKYICSSCHQVGEEGGTVGPDLSRTGFRLSPKWVYRWTLAPQSIKKETKMPSLGMSEDEALAITAYLSTLDEPPAPPESS